MLRGFRHISQRNNYEIFITPRGRRDDGGERNIMKAWQAKCPYCGKPERGHDDDCKPKQRPAGRHQGGDGEGKMKYLPCAYCERKFATEEGRDIHYRIAHRKEKEIKALAGMMAGKGT